MRRRRRHSQSATLVCEELEPRLLLSADLVGVAVDPIPTDTEQADDEADLQVIEAALQTATRAQSDPSGSTTRELVVIDPATPDYQSLLDDLIDRDSGGRGIEVVLLDAGGSGLEQLSDILAEYRDLDAIHLISHGGEGEMRLGGASLDLQALQQSAERIAAWGEALNEDGDWLIYGCDIAATASGERFIEQFAALTGADVAASTDLTGFSHENGDWELEYTRGSIETELAPSVSFQENYRHTLDITTGLLGHWAFDANAADSSGNNYHGTLTNGAAIDTNDATDIVGEGKLSLDGFNDYVNLSPHITSFSGLSQGTISAWINTTSSAVQHIFSIYDRSSPNEADLGVDNGELFFFVENTGPGILLNVEADMTINDGAWHHVAVTVDGSGNNLYVDGVQLTGGALTYLNGNSSTSAFFSSVDFIDDMQIGSIDDSGSGIVNPFNGLIDEVRIYNRALTSSDIAELANQAPTVDSAGITLSEGQTVTLSAADFSVTDPDDSSFTYTLSGVTGGYFQLSGSPGTPISTFTSANLAAGVVQFVDDGDEVAPAFSVSVNDGVSDSNTLAATVGYTPVNDAPDVTGLDGDACNYTEGDGVVLIEQGGDVSVSDPDSGDFAGGSLTVEVDSGLQAAEDRFSLFNQGTAGGEIGFDGSDVTYGGLVIGSVTGGTGIDPLTVAFNSNATPAAVTALIRNITYENSNAENPTGGTRSVTIDITDGDGGASLTQNLTLNVSSVNDAPVVDLNGSDGAGTDFAVTFTEDAGAVNVVDTDATISDADSATYQNLSINLVGFPDGASEQITIAGYLFTYGTSEIQTRTLGGTSFEIDFDGTGFNVTRDGGGVMPQADLQSLLRGVSYENTSQDPTAGDRTINIFAQDSSLLTGPIATSTITVNPQNDSPTATDNTNSVSESGFVSGNVITDDSGSGVDSDPEGDGLQVTQVEGGAYTPGLPLTLASGAQVTFQSNGSYTYNTNGQFDGLGAGGSVDDSFSYQIGDGNGGFATATVTITVNGSNNAPLITSAGLTLDEGQTVTLADADFAITDADDTAFDYTVSGISGGYFQLSSAPGTPITTFTSADLTGGLVQFVDNGDETAPAFSVTVNDGDTDSNTLAATINFTLVSDTTPVANADNITVAEGGTATALAGGSPTVLDNDAGLGDTPVTVSLVTDVNNGTLTLNGDGTFSYTHDGTENFADSFTYRVTDNDGETADATVTINVTPVSDQTPVANADSITVAEGATVTTLVGGSSTVLNNDTGLGDTPVTVSLVTDVTNGLLILNGDGSFSYTHDGSENFTDSFTYRITDNDGETADVTVSIDVTPVSDATPVANADSISVAEGGTATTLLGGSTTVLDNDVGLGDTPAMISLVTDVTNGTLTLNGDGTFSYTHDGSENFTDSFTYRVTDNDGETADATVTIDIVSTNSSPEAADTGFSVIEDTPYTGNLPTASDGDGDTVAYQLVSGPGHGSAAVDTNGGFSYTPDADYHGADNFIYSVSDGNGGFNSYLVEIDVVAVNDSPVITSHGEDENVLLAVEENSLFVTTVAADDPDDDAVSFAIDGGTDLGLFTIDPASGELVFIDAPDSENPLDSDQDNLYQVQVLVADGNGGTDRQTFTIEVRDVDEFDVGLLLDLEATPDTISLADSFHDSVGITAYAEDPDCSNNRITYSLDDDADGLFAIDPSSGVVTLASAVEDPDAAQFEITVRATSADGSYSLKSFNISLDSVIEPPPEPEQSFLDDIIVDLGPTEPVESDGPVYAQPEETIEPSPPATAVDWMNEPIPPEQASDGLGSSLVLATAEERSEPERPVIDRLDDGLFDTEGRNSTNLGFMQIRFTPTAVSPDELPLIDTSSNDLVEVPDTIWNLLDIMNREMSDHRNEQASGDGVVLQSATFGTLALSAGYVAWLLRAGVLSASLLSFSPLWRQVDPLPVLSAHAKRRDENQERLKEQDPDEQRLARLFDRKRKPKRRRALFPGKDG
ncbi:MAG: Ig-like domain-containing protein [Candidatus Thiodiazotropha sp.]